MVDAMTRDRRAPTLPDDNDRYMHKFARDERRREMLEDARMVSDTILKLREVRKGALLKQPEVAETMGTSTSFVSNIENEVHDPRISTLTSYARAVGVRLQLQVCHGNSVWTSPTQRWRAQTSGTTTVHYPAAGSNAGRVAV